MTHVAGSPALNASQASQASGKAQPLSLTLGISDYDHVRDLVDGRIPMAGIRLVSGTRDINEILRPDARPDAFDLTEMSFTKYISMVADGNAPIVAIPVFPSRVFRHSAIYVRRDRSIQTPRDLEGRTVGIPEWSQTAGIYVRGFLRETYDVDLTKIAWLQAGVNSPGRREKIGVSLPPQICYSSRQDTTLSQMLADGDIDAVISARPPACFQPSRDDRIARLWPDPVAEEQAYFRQTGIFPILHVVTLRRELRARHEWLADELVRGFEQARDAALSRLFDLTASRVPLPWATFLAEQSATLMGRDLWPYGIAANRPTLEAFCRYALDQGIIRRPVTVDALFA